MSEAAHHALQRFRDGDDIHDIAKGLGLSAGDAEDVIRDANLDRAAMSAALYALNRLPPLPEWG